jgi:hypothetical protein
MTTEGEGKPMNFESGYTGSDRHWVLSEIMHLVDMRLGRSDEGWTGETARLFAIDTAMTIARRHARHLADGEVDHIVARLQEARALVVTNRDDELGYLQAAMECQLGVSSVGPGRKMWLIAIDALIPNPYRAALVSTRSALSLDASATLSDLGRQLRDRLIARLDEGILLDGPAAVLHLTA